MITLNFDVNDQTLTRQDENTVAANSRLVHTCEFTFSSEWDGRGKVATFKKRDLMLSVIVDDTTSSCVLPPEILQSENKIDVFELSICGADGNSTITSTIVRVPILAGTWDPFTEEITPTLFEQIMQKIDEIEKGEVSPELIYEAVTEYMEAHPLEPIIADDVAAYFAAHAEELKGDKGDTGATPSITATAEVNNAVGTPSVTVTKTGTTEAPNLNFAFQNLKGAKGDTGATPTISAAATVDNTTGTPTVNVSKTGTDAAPEFTFAFTGLKGPKGDPGTPGASYDDTEIRAEINDVWKVQGELGAKNLVVYPYSDSDNKTTQGITYTVNDDISITVNGTSAAYNVYDLHNNDGFILPIGKYKLTLDSAENNPCTLIFVVKDRESGTNYVSVSASYGSARTFTVTQNIYDKLVDNSAYIIFRIGVEQSGITLDNVTLYPMLRFEADTDKTWQPYVPTNNQLNKNDGKIWNAQSKLGVKNLILPFNQRYYYPNRSSGYGGITFTILEDGAVSVTTNGIAATGYGHISFCVTNSTTYEHIKFDAGKYIFSAFVDNPDAIIDEAQVGALIRYQDFERGTQDFPLYLSKNSTNTSRRIEITQEMAQRINDGLALWDIRVFGGAGLNCNDVVVRVMLRFADDADETWMPCAMTNKQLTDDVTIFDVSSDFYSVLATGVSLTNVTVWKQGKRIFGDFNIVGLPTTGVPNALYLSYIPKKAVSTYCFIGGNMAPMSLNIDGSLKINKNEIAETTARIHIDYVCQ